MTMTKAIKNFERLCHFLKLDKEERIHKMLEMFCPDIAIFVETGGQPATVTECNERALCAEFRLNQMKEEKAKKHESGKRNKGSSSKVATESSNSENGQGNKKKAKFSDLESQKMRSRKRSYVLKAYCRRCRHNHAGVCREKNIIYFYCEGKGNLARNCPNKKSNEDKKTH